ncbi:TPA: hypothetical protein NHP87_004806 [Pseudomonas aeruginosa]|uniref:hypothetical protein n=1 Tax=Pseudomonas aeruginosa TaxID=287 RepID=UPI003D9C2E12|nr:hypothetical protein [Pseudomonas aeruginosa]
MQVHIWKRKEGDIVTLKLAERGNEQQLLQQLRDEGIELIFGPNDSQVTEVCVRAPASLKAQVDSDAT